MYQSYINILSIINNFIKFHEKTLSRSGDIKLFRPGRRMYMYTLPAFTDKVLSEERHLMKWVGIFHVGIFRGDFPRGSLMSGNFPEGNFPGGIFLEPHEVIKNY